MGFTKIGSKDIIKKYLGTKQVLKEVVNGVQVYGQSTSEPIYGVSWVNDNSTTMTRTDDATEMTYSINTTTGTITSDFNNVFPWNEATTITDNSGNKFLHFPDMYFRVGKDANGDINSVAVSKAEGVVGDWYLCEAFDYGLYGGSLNGTLLESKSGQIRKDSATRAQFRTYAGNNSETGYIYHQLDLKHKIVTMFLWWIEWATKDSSSIMTGHILGSPSYNNSKIATGGTDSLATPSGYDINTWQMRYHYIEDFVGNTFEFIDGALFDTELYTTDDPAYFSDTKTSMTVSGITRTSNGSCPIAIGWNDSKPFLAWASKTINASSYDVGFCSGWYNSNSTSSNVICGAFYSANKREHGLLGFFRDAISISRPGYGGRLLRQ